MKNTLGFYVGINFPKERRIEPPVEHMFAGDTFKGQTLFGEHLFVVKSIDKDSGFAEHGDLIIFVQKKRKFWYHSPNALSKKAIENLKIK